MKTKTDKWLRLNRKDNMTYEEAKRINKWLRRTDKLTYKLHGKMFLIVTKPWRNHHYFDGVYLDIKCKGINAHLDKVEARIAQQYYQQPYFCGYEN